ncbi:MAG: HAMP domain-containing histidine kinase [Planctomycetes bacterium]|nr:HAMP domain-containing histidine kinase [Planctomycetota bacterium]
MDSPPRIALVSDRDGDLYRALRATLAAARVEVFDELAGSFDAVRTMAPALLVHGAPVDAEEIGALRVFRGILGGTAIVLAARRDEELAAARHAERLGATLLVAPFTPAGLSAAIAAARRGPDLPSPDAFLDLLRGISDELNNPLLAAGGHLQLAECLLDPARDVDAISRLSTVKAELARIGATIERIGVLARVRSLRHPLPSIDLHALLVEIAAEAEYQRHQELAAALGAALPTIPADRDTLALALRSFLTAGIALAGHHPLDFAIRAETDAVVLEITIPAPMSAALGPDAVFSPYHVARAMRGTPFGLALFLVQAIVHAHGGEAIAERRFGRRGLEQGLERELGVILRLRRDL